MNELGSSYTVVGSCGMGKAIVGSTKLDSDCVRSTGVGYIADLDVGEDILDDSSKAIFSCSSSSRSMAFASSWLISSTFFSSRSCSSAGAGGTIFPEDPPDGMGGGEKAIAGDEEEK